MWPINTKDLLQTNRPQHKEAFTIRGEAQVDGPRLDAVREVFGAKALVQRCTLHKRRNLADQLPDKDKEWVDAMLVKAFSHPDPEQGLRNAKQLAAQLDRSYPGAAASLREGLEEMFTVARWASTAGSPRR